MSYFEMDPTAVSGQAGLLPIEEEKMVNGQMSKVKTFYLAEITSSELKTSKGSGEPMLKLVFSIDTKEGRVNIDHYASLSRAAQRFTWKILNFFGQQMKFNPDDLLGRWAWITIKHDSFETSVPDPMTGKTETVWQNKVDTFNRIPTKDEVAQHQQIQKDDLPF